MLEAARHFEDYQMVIAAAPSVGEAYYKKFLGDSEAKMVKMQTYELLSHSTVALVTSGTATLETALLNIPQVVCYETPVPKLIRFASNTSSKCALSLLLILSLTKRLYRNSLRIGSLFIILLTNSIVFFLVNQVVNVCLLTINSYVSD